ncbi:MAG: pre-peptidase C-terminal domain-containing protein [Hyphomicrobiaceae bacterium]|nr:pre-peptidase C-terminal domain-containing protein [Hyphomicrobiaceae bacterium]
MNIGFENDIVFEIATTATSATDHLINYDDAFDDIISLPPWYAHDVDEYIEAVERISVSTFSNQMTPDSWIVLDFTPENVELSRIPTGGSILYALGSADGDVILGASERDAVEGFDGADSLAGGANDDTLLGGAGADTLDGGTVGPHVTNSASVTVPVTGETLAISLETPQATDDASARVAGVVRLTGGTAQNYNIAYVFDRSGSMSSLFGGNAAIGDFNGNGLSNELIDGAILAFRSLNQSVVNSGAGASDVGLIAFDSFASTVYTGPATGGVEAALAALGAGGNTNFEAALQQAVTFLQGAGAGINRVFFVSDGENNTGGSFLDEVQTLIDETGIDAEIRAIGLGTGASLAQLNQLDNTGGAEIALSPGQLTAGLIGTEIASSIARVEILVNGTVRATLLPSQLEATSDGLKFTATVPGLSTTASDTITARVVMSNPASTTASTSVTVANRSDDDELRGGADNDVYNFSAGFGSDVIIETGGAADRVVLAADLVDYDLRPNQTDRNDLDIFVEDIDVITIEDFFDGGANIVESMTLGDGRQISLTGGLTVQGSSAADWLRGTDSDDIVLAGGGNDQIVGGTGGGNDIYDGGAGSDTIYYSSATVSMRIDLGAPLDQASSTQTGVDDLFNIENVVGGSANDTIYGSAGNNVLAGLGGADRIEARGGADSMNGGDGNDIIYGDSPDSGLGLGSGTFTKTAATGNNSTAQAVDISSLFSLAADPDIANATTNPHVSITATANGAVDFYRLVTTAPGIELTLDIDYAGSGATSFDSYVRLLDGQGNLIVSDDDSGTTEGAGGSTSGLDSFLTYTTLTAGTFYIEVGAYPGAVAIPNGAIYELQVSVGAGAFQANGGNDTLIGGLGIDTLVGGYGNDIYYVDNAGDLVTEILGRGTDTVHTTISKALFANTEILILSGSAGINGAGNELANTLIGNGGANVLDGRAGIDTMTGGGGNDTYYLDNAGDLVTEQSGQGTDTVHATVSKALFANTEILILDGSASINGAGNDLANTLIGNGGANVLDGRGGNDRMFGHGGNDTYVVDNASDLVGEAAGNGIDTVRSTITYTLGNEVENLQLLGTANINGTGNGLGNALVGNAGSNRLDGGTGNDSLTGGLGIDYLTSGVGNDNFIYNSLADSAGSAVDRILDFATGDRIWLTDIDANATVANDQAFVIDTNGSFSAGEIRQTIVGSNLFLEMNTNATAAAEMAILLIGRNTLLTSSGFAL